MLSDVDYELRLVEEAVITALRGHPEEGAFRAERDRVYPIADPDARERAFAVLHGRWFDRLALARPLRDALDEQSEIGVRCGRCVVTRPLAGGDESADLLVRPNEPPMVLVLVTPETMSAPEHLRGFLRHELFHVADMLCPDFGYEPRLTTEPASPRDRLLRERYRVLWDAYIDGRLARRARVPPTIRDQRRREFARAFPELGERAEAAFARFFDARASSHAELSAFAHGGTAPFACPLCGLPTRALVPAGRLSSAALAAVTRDFASWRPATGLCSRCAELYESRAADSPSRGTGPTVERRARSC